jgi:hypothetical protein
MEAMKPQRSKKKLAKTLTAVLVLPLLVLSWLILAPSSLSTTLEGINFTFSSGQSANYRITADVLVEGGEPGSSGNYRISDVIGSAVEGGESSSNNFKLLSGPLPGLYPGEPFSNTITAPLNGDITATQSISVTGETLADASVVIRVGEDQYTTTADHDGDYVVPDVALALGYNMIESQGTNAYGNRATASVAISRTTYSLTGMLCSRVHDAGQSVTWGTITWQADTPAGTSIVFRTRTRDAAPPDDSCDDDGLWSDWSGVYAAPGQAISSPPNQYIQYEALLWTADGSVSPALEDVTIIYTDGGAANILLVDDDEGASYETYYQNALSANGYSFDNWNVASQGSPPLSTLQDYSVLIWFTGDDWLTTLADTDQANLQAYLDDGGNIFISGQDIGWDLTRDGSAANAFFTDYLHASYVQDDVNLDGLNGVSGDPISDGLNPTISGGDGANNQNYPSEIDPLPPAVTALSYGTFFVSAPVTSPEAFPESQKAEPRESQKLRVQGISSSGSGAIRACTEMYKAVYFAFGFEAINSATDRNTVMGRVMDWFSSPYGHPDCFGDFDFDCEVTVQDIQQVASRWRMTEADDDWDPWYDLNDDAIITVVDIMLVAAHWGETCP